MEDVDFAVLQYQENLVTFDVLTEDN